MECHMGNNFQVAEEPVSPLVDPPAPFFPSPQRYDSNFAAKLLDIGRTSTELDPTSCLITRTPFANGTVQISHLVNDQMPEPQVSHSRQAGRH